MARRDDGRSPAGKPAERTARTATAVLAGALGPGPAATLDRSLDRAARIRTTEIFAAWCAVVRRLWHPSPGTTAVISTGLTVAAPAFEPVRSTLAFGRIDLVLMALVAVDCLAPNPRRPRGVLVGLAAAIAVTPGDPAGKDLHGVFPCCGGRFDGATGPVRSARPLCAAPA